MDIKRLVIADPSGNITAIVFDPTPREFMRQIGATIQSEYPSVEQVLFVEKKGSAIHGQMAGGEFCGNAARALGWVLAEQKDSVQGFTMSGAAQPIPVSVEVIGTHATLKTRMGLAQESVAFEDASIPVVHLEGISHAVISPAHPMYNFLKRTAARPDRWMTVTHVLEDLGIKDKPASGLIFAEKNGTAIDITPYVYVRDINTLYPEKACASGSIAAAYALGGEMVTQRACLSIHQPSNEILQVALRPQHGSVEITVAGNMRVVYDGPAAEMHYSSAMLVGTHGTVHQPLSGLRQAAL